MVGQLSPKKYSSHTSMLIQETAKLNPFLEDLAVSAMLKERMSALNTLLHSRHILGVVAEKMNLVSDNTGPEERDLVISKLSNSLDVNMMGKDLIRIDYRSSTPEVMKETLEVISQQFVEQLLAPEHSSIKDSSNFLSTHLKQRQIKLDEAEQALAAFRDNHATDLPELHLTNISRLSKLKQRLSEKEAEMAGASKSLGGLDQQLSKTNPVLGKIEEQIVKIRGELALFRARYTDKHSLIMAAKRNLNSLEDERQIILLNKEQNLNIEKLWDIASSTPANSEHKGQTLLVSQLVNIQAVQSKVNGLSEEIISLKRMISELEKQVSSYGANASEFSKLERELAIKRDLYDDLLIRKEKASITGSLGIFERDKRIKVIDRPFTPVTTTNIPAIIFAIAGFFGGLFLGCGLAIILELSDSTIRRIDQLEALTKTPVLSRIPPLTHLIEIN